MMLRQRGRDALLVLCTAALLTGSLACAGTSPDRPTLTPAATVGAVESSTATPEAAGARTATPPLTPTPLPALVSQPTTAPTPTPMPTARERCARSAATRGFSDSNGLIDDCALLLRSRDTLAGTAVLNWSEGTPLEDWDGVTVGGDPERVTGLRLAAFGLSGSIPVSMGFLGGLREVDLRNNGLTGEIPPSLGTLAELRGLALNGNQLTGTIPPRLGDLARLQLLNLANNDLSGEIPSRLGELVELEHLDLAHNDLTGSIPRQIGELAALRALHLNGNRLRGSIPSTLDNLETLESLYLANDERSALSPGNGGWAGCVSSALRDVGDTDLDALGLRDCAALGDHLPFPRDLALIVELGCRQCDAPQSGYARIYRDPSGTVRGEALFGEDVGGWAGASGHILVGTFVGDASDMVVSVCSGGHCGDMDSLPLDPELTYYRSRDGGVTWQEVARLDAVAVSRPVPDGGLLVSQYADATWTHTRHPGGEVVTPPEPGSHPVAFAGGELLWISSTGELLLTDGRARTEFRLRDLGLAPFGSATFLDVPAHDHDHVTPLMSGGLWAALYLRESWYVANASVPSGYGYAVQLVLVDVTDPVGVVHPVSDLPMLPIRRPVALQRGPFGRVVAGEGGCLHVRATPSTEGRALDCAADGVLLRLSGEPRGNWIAVSTPAGVEGWSDVGFLELPRSGGVPAP